MCRTFVGHPISIWWTAEEIPPTPTSSWRLSTRQETTDLRSAVSRNSTRDSCCWFCSSSSSSTVDFPLPPPFLPAQPTPLVTITSPVIAQSKKVETKGCSRDKDHSLSLSRLCGSSSSLSLEEDEWVWFWNSPKRFFLLFLFDFNIIFLFRFE